jgi:hypothetical protein
VLIFTKYDIFLQKIASKKKPFRHYIPEYEGEETAEAILIYIMARFTQMYRGPDPIKVFYMNATSMKEVQVVWAEVLQQAANREIASTIGLQQTL